MAEGEDVGCVRLKEGWRMERADEGFIDNTGQLVTVKVRFVTLQV